MPLTQSDLPDEVRRFIAHHIESVEQVEILLLLYQHSERAWSAEAVARELRIAPRSAGERMEGMMRSGLLSRQGVSPEEYRYAPRDTKLEEGVRGLSAEYALRRVTIVNFIYSKPIDKIRTFADAFRLKKDDDHG
jgi:DNA-binding Lrp family transcriptional regulator